LPLSANPSESTTVTDPATDATHSTSDSNPATIDFKGISLPVMQIVLGSLDPEQIASAIQTRFGKNVSRFFADDPAVLDLNKIAADSAPVDVDWHAVSEQLASASLQLIAVYGGSTELQASARAAGLAVIDTPPVSRAAAKTPAPKKETKPAEPATPPSAAAMVVDKPLRSGQRIYARGTDLVVLAMVSAGAEVIADGNIHIYAPLRGRALAGAQGDAKARIFTTSFEAELVSIAGVYRTFESPQSVGKLAGQPVQVSLVVDASGGDAKLNVAALATK
jgi:septum site-determining protein MinC